MKNKTPVHDPRRFDPKPVRELCREQHRCRRQIEHLVHDEVHEAVRAIEFDDEDDD